MLLTFKIVACTSEDGDHPVRELQGFHSQSRGWQSSRWCNFPQALILKFPGRVSLQQVQVLSHQFKIASRIEMFIGDVPSGMTPPVANAEGVEYMRLGHFSLDSNVRSGFQARELKTVYVPRASEGCFLKLLLHKCHVNEHNLFNQLGLLAVRAIGTGPGAIAAPSRAPADPLSVQMKAAAPQPRVPHESHGAAMDQAVVALIREIEERKREAVAMEDFDEAKRLKARVEELKLVGVELAAIDQRKASAIESEDYDLAKELKTQLNDLRASSGVPPPLLVARAKTEHVLQHGGLGGPSEELQDAVTLEMAAAQQRINQMVHQVAFEPAPPSDSVPLEKRILMHEGAGRGSEGDWFEGVSCNGSCHDHQRQGACNDGELHAQLERSVDQGSALPGTEMARAASLGELSPSLDPGDGSADRAPPAPSTACQLPHQLVPTGSLPSTLISPAPPLPADGSTSSLPPVQQLPKSVVQPIRPPTDLFADFTHTPPPPMPTSQGLASAAQRQQSSAFPQDDFPNDVSTPGQPQPPRQQPALRVRATTQAAHEERIVGQAVADLPEQPPGSDPDLPAPEPLVASDEKDPRVQELVDVFGDHLVRCLFSRVWSLRQTGLMQIADVLPQLQVDGRSVVHATCRVVSRCASDKMVQVFLAAMHLFMKLFERPAVMALPRAEWAQLLSPLLPVLLLKLGDGNHRVKDATESALLATCRLPQLGPQPVMQALLAPLSEAKEKDSRLQVRLLHTGSGRPLSSLDTERICAPRIACCCSLGDSV